MSDQATVIRSMAANAAVTTEPLAEAFAALRRAAASPDPAVAVVACAALAAMMRCAENV